MQRTLLLSALALFVSVGTFAGGLQARSGWFTDVPSDHWAKAAIDYVSDEGLMKGMSADTFAPDAAVTRAQLAMVLYRQSQQDAPVYPTYDEVDEYVPPTYDPATIDDDAIQGKETAPVTLIEFGDYECPFCKRHFDQTLPLIKKNYIDTGKVRFVFRDFPLSFHPHAYAAAEASECADEQGKFWGMHDRLFKDQEEWMDESDPTDTFNLYAGTLKLNTTDFNTCLESGDMSDEIEDDMEDGTESGIQGTPGSCGL